MRQVHHLEQGSPEWHAHRNTPGIFNGSELAILMNLSSYVTYSEFLRRKATGIEPEYDAATLARFADGHRNEALARPLAEEIIGEDLSAMVLSDTIDGVLMSVSLDGITQDYSITNEHKSLNMALAAAIDAGYLPDEYHPQCESGLMVSKASRCLFMASKWDKDGKLIEEKHIWYYPNPELRTRIIAACKQFQSDLADYQHVEVAEPPHPKVSVDLPALFIHAQGQITDSNMQAYGAALAVRLAEVRSIRLVTDQDFSDAKSAAAIFREQRTKLQAAKEAMLSQTVTIGEAARMIDAWSEDLRLTALQLEKDVEAKDKAIKLRIMCDGAAAFDAHVFELNTRLGGNYSHHFGRPILPDAIRNKRTYTSMTASVAGAVAAAKVEATMVADRIESNRKTMAGEAYDFSYLVPDFLQVCAKESEDFAALLFQRRTGEEQRIEAERVRKEKEEAYRATLEAARAEAETEAAVAAAVESERMAEAKRVAEMARSMQAEITEITNNAQAKAQAAQDARDEDQRGKADVGVGLPDGGRAQPDAAITPPLSPEAKRAVMVESGDVVRAYLNSLDIGETERTRLRPILMGFKQFEASYLPKVAA